MRISRKKLYHKQKIIHCLAGIFCALFIAGLALSAFFLVAHSGHAHIHTTREEGCSVCFWISAAENLLQSFHAALWAAFCLSGAFFVFRAAFRRVHRAAESLTLVQRKVRLNN